MGLLTELGDVVNEGLVSQTLASCSRWVTHRRIMGEPFPGNYSFKYHPWCKDIHDSSAGFNTVMKAAQMGLTEVAINVAFHTVDIKKRDVLYVLPTALNASDFSKSRFNTALLHSSYLKGLFTDTNTVGLKQAGGVSLYIRGSRGDSNLKSIPVSCMVLDEMDEMDIKQVWLALERLSGHLAKNRFVFSLSTPTIPQFGIHKLFLQGTQEHFYFKCPRCGRRTEFTFPECLEICGETITDPDVRRSHLICKECKKKIEHEEKLDFLKDAFWEPTIKVDEDHRSFYINQMYSYTVTPHDLALAYFRGIGDEAAMVEFHNSKQGLPYIPDGGQVTESEIDVSIQNYFKEEQRPDIGTDRCIVMGIDQGKFNNIVVVEFLLNGTMDLNASAFAKVLWMGKRPGDDFTNLDPLMREWQVRACVIDADPQINDARRFAKRFPGYVYLCRYRRGVTGKELALSEEDSGSPIVTVDRTNWLDASMGRFHSDRLSLPADVPLEFKDHIKAMVRTYEKDDQGNPKALYLNTGPDHYAHAFNYAEIALPLAVGAVAGGDVNEKVI